MSNPFDGAVAGALPMALAVGACVLIFGGGPFLAGGIYLATGEIPGWAQRAGISEDTFRKHHFVHTNVWCEACGECEQKTVWVPVKLSNEQDQRRESR